MPPHEVITERGCEIFQKNILGQQKCREVNFPERTTVPVPYYLRAYSIAKAVFRRPSAFCERANRVWDEPDGILPTRDDDTPSVLSEKASEFE